MENSNDFAFICYKYCIACYYNWLVSISISQLYLYDRQMTKDFLAGADFYSKRIFWTERAIKVGETFFPVRRKITKLRQVKRNPGESLMNRGQLDMHVALSKLHVT